MASNVPVFTVAVSATGVLTRNYCLGKNIDAKCATEGWMIQMELCGSCCALGTITAFAMSGQVVWAVWVHASDHCRCGEAASLVASQVRWHWREPCLWNCNCGTPNVLLWPLRHGILGVLVTFEKTWIYLYEFFLWCCFFHGGSFYCFTRSKCQCHLQYFSHGGAQSSFSWLESVYSILLCTTI